MDITTESSHPWTVWVVSGPLDEPMERALEPNELRQLRRSATSVPVELDSAPMIPPSTRHERTDGPQGLLTELSLSASRRDELERGPRSLPTVSMRLPAEPIVLRGEPLLLP